MTDQTMIEKVARALALANFPAASDRDIDDMWEGFALEAEAAIRAMREPTIQMVQRGAEDADPVGCCHMAPSNAADVWQIMIDAALKGDG